MCKQLAKSEREAFVLTSPASAKEGSERVTAAFTGHVTRGTTQVLSSLPLSSARDGGSFLPCLWGLPQTRAAVGLLLHPLHPAYGRM